MRQRFAEAGRPLADSELTRVLYRETRCRNHFGKGIVEGWLANIVTLSPLMDPDLYRLRLSSEQCSDRNVLSALILDRYAPDLLSFPFEGGRSIDPATVSSALRRSESSSSLPMMKKHTISSLTMWNTGNTSR